MTSPAVVDGVDIDAVTAAVRICPAVHDLYSTAAATVASYLPGRLVPGVRVNEGTVTIQVRSYWGIPIIEVADQVRTAVAPLVAHRAVDVMIADITDPPADETPETPVAALAVLPAPSAPAPVLPVPVLPLDVGGEPAEQDEVVWTSSTGAAAVSSSAPTIPTAAEIPPPSSTA